MIELMQKIHTGKFLLLFYRQDSTIAFTMIPADMEDQLATHRTVMPETHATRSIAQRFPLVCDVIDSMIQLKLNIDRYHPQFFPGFSMRNSGSVSALTFSELIQTENEIIVRFEHPQGLIAEQVIEHVPGKDFLKLHTRLIHHGEQELTLEYLAGCSLGMLSPFQPDDGWGKYYIHRFQTTWDGEGRPLVQSMEEANLEMSWLAAGLRNIRFGVNGSMPIRGFFPFLALEDRQAGVFWGIQADAAASWELEVCRTGDVLNLSGGYPGREAGGWQKIIHPGETFESMKMIVSCAQGTVDDLCVQMLEYQKDTFIPKDAMDVAFNEYCVTWGRPWKKYLEQLIGPVKQAGAKYFILDAGWFRNDSTENRGCVGDWDPKDEMYPDGGLAGMIEQIRNAGLIPGIWFEFEITMEESQTAQQHPDWFLTLDGVPLKHGPRMFLDFRKPEVLEHLREKVCSFLRKYDIGYVKVDYNATTAGMCDGPENPAENHRKHTECIMQFFRELKQTLPGLVLEICASGGQRLSPAWAQIADKFSFSDAHEGTEVPLIAANVQRMVPAHKCQIWATLRPWDTENMLFYKLCAGFMGCLCLSGDLDQLTAEQLEIVQQAVGLCQKHSALIRDGRSTVEQHWNKSFSHPEGWQKVCFDSNGQQLTVVHIFGNPPDVITFPADAEQHQLFAPQGIDCTVQDGMFTWRHPTPFTALVLGTFSA